MSRSVQVVRLLAAFMISIAACQFTVLYDQGSLARYYYEHSRNGLFFTPVGE